MATYPMSQNDDILEDRISRLPNDVLVDILSFLTFKEAGRSCVLGKRWRDLWKLIGNLDFDASEVQFGLDVTRRSEIGRSRQELERTKFLSWVNQVVRAHEGPFIDEFRVVFCLDIRSTNEIDEWIRFMIHKRAKEIEINLYGFTAGDHYAPSRDCCNYIKSMSNKPSLVRLRSLSLSSVDVDGELLEYLLSVCPILEMLSVTDSDRLVSLKVAGPNLALKYLKIDICRSMESIELCAPKLVSFFYFGRKVKYVVGSNPLLVEFYIGGGYREEVTHALVPFSFHLARIETLTLEMTWEENCGFNLPAFGELSNLKHLIVKLDIGSDQSIMSLTKFIEAAPSLVKFTLMMVYHWVKEPQIRETRIQPHNCLKEVEIFGFNGSFCVVELAQYLIKNAINLEKMVIDPFRRDEYYERKDTAERVSKFWTDAKILQESLPSCVELIVNDKLPAPYRYGNYV